MSPGPPGASPAGRRLVLLAAAGDDAAFQALVAAHGPRIRAFLRRATGDAALADDLAQAVFLKAWRSLGSLREPTAFGGWLRRIAVNAAIDAARARGLADEDLEDAHGAAPAAERLDQRLDLEAALGRLSFPARTCILLHHGEGLSHSEIAAETGIPIGTVKSHIARATALLRASLTAWSPSHG